MSCAFCGMPPRDGEGCCTGAFRASMMRRADRRIKALEVEIRTARASAFEEAAKIADEHLNDEKNALNAGGYIEACMHIAAAIRSKA